MGLTRPLKALVGAAGVETLREEAARLLARADVQLDGDRPWDLEVHDERVFRRTFAEGNLGLGEAYMDGWWDCEALDEFFYRVQRADLHDEIRRNPRVLAQVARARLVNLQSGDRAWTVGEQHYDLDCRTLCAQVSPTS